MCKTYLMVFITSLFLPGFISVMYRYSQKKITYEEVNEKLKKLLYDTLRSIVTYTLVNGNTMPLICLFSKLFKVTTRLVMCIVILLSSLSILFEKRNHLR